MKGCTKSLVTREMQVRTTVKYSFLPARIAIIKNMNNKWFGENVERLKPSHVVDRNKKEYTVNFRKWFGIFLET